MRMRSICRKAILVIYSSLLMFPLGGKNEVASKALSQTTCGEWNLALNGGKETSQDGKISIKLVHPTDMRCEGTYTVNNNTGVASIGGYTLELVVDSQNADVRVLESTLLTPYRPIDIKAEPLDKNKAALVNIQGQMTKRAYLFDFAYLTGKSIINHLIPASLCIIPNESLAMVTIRLLDITSHAAAEFGEGNFRAASEEFSGVFDALLEAMIESLKEAGENCAVDALKLKLGKVGAQKIQIFLDVAKWLVPWYRDYFNGEWSYLTLSYFATGKTDLTAETTPTVISQTRTADTSEIILQELDPRIDYTDMVYVPAGEFQMGCDPNHNAGKHCPSGELPLHPVYLDAYFIDKYEITNAEYRECVDIGACNPHSDIGLDKYYGNPEFNNYPVTNIGANDAAKYCEWWGKRLPTEAEWEKAARGTTPRAYPWGDENPTCSLVNGMKCIGAISEVGSYPAGASPYGVMDMAGNVSEWVIDCLDGEFYSKSPYSNPIGSTSSCYHVLRGGTWESFASDLNTSSRFSWGYISGDNEEGMNFGFRCVADLNNK